MEEYYTAKVKTENGSYDICSEDKYRWNTIEEVKVAVLKYLYGFVTKSRHYLYKDIISISVTKHTEEEQEVDFLNERT